MKDWFIYSFIALLLWGLWGFFPKLAIRYISPRSAFVYECLGSVIVGIFALVLVGFRPEVKMNGMIFAILTGIAGTFGALFFLYAMARGKTSVVVTTSALYPIVTILLAFIILKEPVTFKEGIGILFALMAIVMFSL
ncbi:hypothetical protein COV93_05730 [Candidatus Woesearchaeota archaeon CG11_big_fil_rev_8_21_14_0_20_43_8]|nr:MAG: hypothetical protein COV93_05730 [Candidatus Woesearchaeota archaeon CG11_big_fil_rev_8_21_14_0_20_43_8]PIO05214.1 MAG: hypothetical protein COT47_05705 [Candidatus Woesearchaeota archaeon CG08_land_8_20_14_0_20_43_7]